MRKVGQNLIYLYVYAVYIWYFSREITIHTYGHIWCVYTVPAHPKHAHRPTAEDLLPCLYLYACIFVLVS